jgi:hypothetical protein
MLSDIDGECIGKMVFRFLFGIYEDMRHMKVIASLVVKLNVQVLRLDPLPATFKKHGGCYV